VSGQARMELYVDPCCPFAWIAYQWLAEVQQHRALELGLQLMSLPMLNEHQSISPGYRRLLAHTWGAGAGSGRGRPAAWLGRPGGVRGGLGAPDLRRS
jgi:predicted DsbA family dithiol-disulfide isomerase